MWRVAYANSVEKASLSALYSWVRWDVKWLGLHDALALVERACEIVQAASNNDVTALKRDDTADNKIGVLQVITKLRSVALNALPAKERAFVNAAVGSLWLDCGNGVVLKVDCNFQATNTVVIGVVHVGKAFDKVAAEESLAIAVLKPRRLLALRLLSRARTIAAHTTGLIVRWTLVWLGMYIA
jgi:hypothetical protein